MFLPGDYPEANPFVMERTREARAQLFADAVASKWAYYKSAYGYVDTLDSSLAAAPHISSDLLLEFPAHDAEGNRQNDAETVYALIKPFGMKLPWFVNWKIAAGIVAVIFIAPGVLGRYAKGRA